MMAKMQVEMAPVRLQEGGGGPNWSSDAWLNDELQFQGRETLGGE